MGSGVDKLGELSYDNRSHYFRLWSLVKAVFSSVYAQTSARIFSATCTRVSNACETRATRV